MKKLTQRNQIEIAIGIAKADIQNNTVTEIETENFMFCVQQDVHTWPEYMGNGQHSEAEISISIKDCVYFNDKLGEAENVEREGLDEIEKSL